MDHFISVAKARCAMAAIALTCALPADAKLGSGFFNIYDTVWACLAVDGTWYSPYFPGLGGRWHETGNRMYIFGNYAQGAGNDAMVFSNQHPEDAIHNPGSWTEWRDDMSWFAVAPKVYIYKLADTCEGTTLVPPEARANPLQR